MHEAQLSSQPCEAKEVQQRPLGSATVQEEASGVDEERAYKVSKVAKRDHTDDDQITNALITTTQSLQRKKFLLRNFLPPLVIWLCTWSPAIVVVPLRGLLNTLSAPRRGKGVYRSGEGWRCMYTCCCLLPSMHLLVPCVSRFKFWCSEFA